MIPWLAAAIPAIGSVAGALIDRGSQRAANRANLRSVQEQIAFQERQGSTEYQRAVKDTSAAGLNPSLAYKQGGNAAQTGARTDVQPELSNTQNRLAVALDNYQNFATGSAQRQLLHAQTRKAMIEGNVMQPQAILGQDKDYIEKFIRSMRAEAQSKGDINPRLLEQFLANLGATKQSTATAKQQQDLMKTQTTLNEQDFMNEYFKKNIAPYMSSTAKAIRTLRGGK